MSNIDISFRHISKEYALYTRSSLFITGRAGTGKTTLLKEILDETNKKSIVVAPTGVAAINAGGMTIHSMFQLPTTGFIPTDDVIDPDLFTNRINLARTQKIRRERMQVLLELEMLVIDEISMVRADLLDAIDAVLRRIRKNDQVFGGVQLVVIGDLFQLSPVIKSDRYKILSNYYKSPYFFDSWAWKNVDAITIELSRIYRQDDKVFIAILNNIRIGKLNPEDLEILNRRQTSPPENQGIITLSTHNAKANSINARELKSLNTQSYTLEAVISGTFSSTAYPVNDKILLKKGCQVMFVRNHPEGLYFNGKIGEVTGKFGEEIFVKCKGEDNPIRVLPLEWKNIKYNIDKETKEVFKEDIGSFTQYPLRLAWAVTIHKSQGLTFDEVILDIANTFAPGQLYVALSRCKTIKGLYLTAPVRDRNIIVDERISNYYNSISKNEISPDHLSRAKAEYEDIRICEKWNFNKLLTYIELWIEVIEDGNLPEEDFIIDLAGNVKRKIDALIITSQKFERQLSILTGAFKEDDAELNTIIERCLKAIQYFTEELHRDVIIPLEQHLSSFRMKKGTKRYLPIVESLISDLWDRMNELYKMEYRSIPIHPEVPKFKRIKLFDPKKKKRPAKGETYDITLKLLSEDKNIEEIAEIRSLAYGTIESHISRLLKDSKIDIDQVMSHHRREKISPYFKGRNDMTITEIKNLIPFHVSFGELRWIKIVLDKIENTNE